MEEKNRDDEKLDISKSVFQSAKEMQEQKNAELKRQQDEMQRKIQEREKKKREDYEKKIHDEKIELIKLKQGVIEESETIHEEPEKEVQLTFSRKIANFFYHNKWWLGLGTFMVCMTVFLVYNLLSKPNPDMSVIILCDNESIGYSAKLEEYIEQFAEDFNGNGEVLADTHYIPYTDNAYANYQNGTDTKLTTEMQSADAVIVIVGDNINKMLNPEENLVNLEEIFPDSPYVRGYGFYLRNTSFPERLGIPKTDIGYDIYLGIRKPKQLMYASKEEMQKTYDRDYEVFVKIINDLSE